MATHPFGFLTIQARHLGAHGTVVRLLRGLGLLVLAGVAVSLAAFGLSMARNGMPGPLTMAFLLAVLLGVLAVIAVICLWISFTAHRWNDGFASARKHVLAIGSLALAFGALGVVFGLLTFVVNPPAGPIALGLALLTLLYDAAQALLGGLLLSNRAAALADGLPLPDHATPA